MFGIGFKIDGFDGLQKQLRQLQKNVEKVAGNNEVSFNELFVGSFMRKYTSFGTFEELLEAGGFEVNSQEDFQNIPDDIFDEHISKHTRFKNWEDMMGTAAQEHIARKLGI